MEAGTGLSGSGLGAPEGPGPAPSYRCTSALPADCPPVSDDTRPDRPCESESEWRGDLERWHDRVQPQHAPVRAPGTRCPVAHTARLPEARDTFPLRHRTDAEKGTSRHVERRMAFILGPPRPLGPLACPHPTPSAPGCGGTTDLSPGTSSLPGEQLVDPWGAPPPGGDTGGLTSGLRKVQENPNGGTFYVKTPGVGTRLSERPNLARSSTLRRFLNLLSLLFERSLYSGLVKVAGG